MSERELLAAVGAIPGGNGSQMQTVRPNLKRGISGPSSLADSVVGSVMGKRFRAGPSERGLLGPLARGFPPGIAAAMDVTNTGFSTDDAQTDQIITNSIFLKPFPEGWEQSYTPQTALFSSVAEPDFSAQGLYSVADPAVINHLAELGAMADGGVSVMRKAIMTASGALKQRYAGLIPKSGEDMAAKWAHLGLMTTEAAGGYSSDVSVRTARGNQRLVGFSQFGRAHTFNLFGGDLRKGTQLYFVAKAFDLSPYTEFTAPSGAAISSRTGHPTDVLQVRGFGEAGAPYSMHDTQYGNDNPEPHEKDADYIAKAQRCACEYWDIDYDTALDTFTRRDLIGQEGLAESLESVPDVVWDAYMLGHAYRVGFARDFQGRAPTDREVLVAHRSQAKMKALQVVEVYNGL